MKIILAFFCLCFSASAQLALNNAFYNQFQLRGGAFTYFFTENFETPGYENTWGEFGGGSINDEYDNSPAPLQGLFSLRLNPNPNNSRTTNDFGVSVDTVYGFCLVNFTDFQAGANTKPLITHQDADGNAVFTVAISGNGAGLWFPILQDTNQTQFGAATSMAEDTTYYFWWQYTKGTGNDAIYNLWFSTTGIRGGALQSTVTGQAVSQVRKTMIGVTNNSNFSAIVDKIRLSDSPIGDNPN